MNNVQKEDKNLENQNTNKFLKIQTFLVFSFREKKMERKNMKSEREKFRWRKWDEIKKVKW